MKKFSYLLVLLLGIGVLSSCKKDEDPEIKDLKPTVNLIGSNGYVADAKEIKVGETCKFKVSASSNTNSNARLNKFKLTLTYNNEPRVIGETEDPINAKAFTSDDIEVTFEQVGEHKLLFEIKDRDGVTGSATVTITVKEDKNTFTKVNEVTMGSYDSNTGSFINGATGTVYSIADAAKNAADVDFCFYKAEAGTDAYSFTSITNATDKGFNVANWAVKNETKFQKLDMTKATYDKVFAGDPYIFHEMPASASNSVVQLKASTVYMYEAKDGQKGLILIKELKQSRGAETIKFSMIIEK
ncbi:MAG: hypothetical protein ACEPOV_06045 [Hyphomicrobiales bacterium]